MNPLVCLILGLCLGVLIGWLLRSLRHPHRGDERIEGELRRQLQDRETDLGKVRSELSEAGNARAAAEAGKLSNDSALTEERGRQAALTADLAAVRTLLADESKRLAGSEEEVRFLKERLSTERQQLESIQTKLHTEFEGISNKLLIASTSQFNKQSAESLDTLLKPLKEELKDFKQKLETSQKETATHSALLKNEIGRIGAEAANLSRALKGDVKVLGNWGENMLDQILDKSGLQMGLHYRRQQSGKDDSGDKRVLDVIVELPENQHLIIDSKVSLRHYEAHVNCGDEVLRLELLAEHVGCIRNHFRDLGAKRYQEIHGINAPDFVLMYVPIEAAFFSALAHDPTLFSDALDKNVVLITNSTLLATLRTVAHVWRLADQQKNAFAIADRGGKLYDKFAGFITDLQDVGAALKKSTVAWEAATAKLHTGPGNLLRQAEQLKALGARTSKPLPNLLATEPEALAPANGQPSDAAPLLANPRDAELQLGK